MGSVLRSWSSDSREINVSWYFQKSGNAVAPDNKPVEVRKSPGEVEVEFLMRLLRLDLKESADVVWTCRSLRRTETYRVMATTEEKS